MATNNFQNLVPGNFTGVYTGKASKIDGPGTSLVKVSGSRITPPVTFKQTLHEESTKVKNNNPLCFVSQKIQNVGQYLPFTALVGSEVGPYGLIFASSVLKLCQYYKKPPVQSRMF